MQPSTKLGHVERWRQMRERYRKERKPWSITTCALADNPPPLIPRPHVLRLSDSSSLQLLGWIVEQDGRGVALACHQGRAVIVGFLPLSGHETRERIDDISRELAASIERYWTRRVEDSGGRIDSP